MENNNEKEELRGLSEEELQGGVEEELEVLSEEEKEGTQGGAGLTYGGVQNRTITLKPGQSKTMWGINSYHLALGIESGSNLISANYWGGRAGITITRKGKSKGTAKVKYQVQQIFGSKWYNGKITVKCS